MYHGVLDEDIHPRELLTEGVGDRIDLDVGIEGSEAAAAERLAGADVAFVTSRIPISRRVIEATDLSVVAKIGTGIDNVDLAAAREHGVAVTHTPGINALSVAEHAVGLLLATRRHTVAGHRALEAGRWRDSVPLGTLVSGTTVGLVGLGNVGRRVASLLRGFDVTTLAYDPYVDRIEGEPVHAELVGLGAVLDRSDSVVVAAELTDETRGLVDEDALARMGSDAVLVNVGRGPVVDPGALVDTLRAGELAGAGMDVHATEPLPADSPLHEFENVVLTPHVGGSTETARREGARTLGANALSLLDGEPVPERYLAVRPRH
ncbi:MAG: NAD(P)-dependent oxidoreductase [Haloarculaceae archaeon]